MSPYAERLTETSIEPTMGSPGENYENAQAETINGLQKTGLIHRQAPWKTGESVELATLQWVHWFNHHRLLEPIGYITGGVRDEISQRLRGVTQTRGNSPITRNR